MKGNSVVIILGAMIMFAVRCEVASAQITIKLPDLTQTGKPKTGKSKVENSTTDTTTDKTQGQPKAHGDKRIYDPQRPTATPVLLKNSVYVQAKTHNEYWKMAGQATIQAGCQYSDSVIFTTTRRT